MQVQLLRKSSLLLVGSGLLLAGLTDTPAHAAGRLLGTLEFAPCHLSSPVAPTSFEAQCTTLSVPEDRARPDGRKIDLAIAWVPATGEAAPDPVFLLAGGPGQAAREAWPQMAGAFADVNRTRHVILVDQRGTGGSHPLVCDTPETAQQDVLAETVEQSRALAEQCLALLSKDADVRFYTTTDAIADLDAVRATIGAAQINLVGVSYGTRVAQQYAKTYPAETRTVVLDSTITTELILGSEHAANLQAALNAQFARCQDVPACLEHLGDPSTHLDAVRTQLDAGGMDKVRFRDAVSGDWIEEVPSFQHLGLLLRMYAYQSPTAAILPLLLKQAADGDWAPLLAQARLIGGQLGEQIHHGMQLSVLCSEDADALVADPAVADSVMGNQLVEFTLAQCAIWPRGTVPKDLRTPLSGPVPVLVLAGELDPVTPPRYAEAVVKHLPNGRLLTLPGQGHSTLGIGCAPKLFAQFVESADAKTLDPGCLKRVAPLPPLAGLYGWEP